MKTITIGWEAMKANCPELNKYLEIDESSLSACWEISYNWAFHHGLRLLQVMPIHTKGTFFTFEILKPNRELDKAIVIGYVTIP